MNKTFEQMLNENLEKTPEPEVFKIDGQLTQGYLMTREEFIKAFYELETLLQSDCKKYWVLYDERNVETMFYEEIFWCIPVEEVTFRLDEELGWQLVGGVTLDEEDEENDFIIIEEDSYNNAINKFDQFELNFMHYVMFNKNADEDNFRVWKKLRAFIDSAKEEDVFYDNKMCLITYLEEYWKAWLESILDCTYSYMYCTRMVWESWEKV